MKKKKRQKTKKPRSSSPIQPLQDSFTERDSRRSLTPLPELKEKDHALIIALLLIAGIVLRVLHLSAIKNDPLFISPVLDAKNYENWGYLLSKGKGWQEGAFSSNPLYPLIVATVYSLFERSSFILRLVQGLAGILTSFFLMKVSSRIFGRVVGIVALFLSLFSSTLLLYEGELLAETWVILFISISLHSFIIKRDYICPFISGLFLGLATLGRPNLLLFIPIPIILLLFERGVERNSLAEKGGSKKWVIPQQKGSNFLRAIIFFIGISMTILPVFIRNLSKGDAVLVTAHGGINLFIGNNPHADGWFKTPKGSGLEGGQLSLIESSKKVAEGAVGKRLKPSEVSHYWMEKSLDFILHNPQKALSLLLKKALYFWNRYEKPMVANIYYTKEISPYLKYCTLSFGLIAPFFFVGLTILLFEKVKVGEGGVRLLLLFNLFYFLSVIIFFVSSRYRLPELAGMIPVSSFGIYSLASRLIKKEWDKLIRSALPLLFSGILIHIPLGEKEKDLGHHYYLLGNVLSDRKDYDGAVKAFERALDLKGDDAMILNNLGIALKNRGRNEEAVDVFRRAIRLDPNHKKAYLNLGVSLKRLKRYREAEEAYMHALKLDPRYKFGLHNLGNLYLEEGRMEEAIDYLERALEIDPNFKNSLEKLAQIYHDRGDREKEAEFLKRLYNTRKARPFYLKRYGDLLRDMGEREESLKVYKLYISKEKDAKKRGMVERLIEEMEDGGV